MQGVGFNSLWTMRRWRREALVRMAPRDGRGQSRRPSRAPRASFSGESHSRGATPCQLLTGEPVRSADEGGDQVQHRTVGVAHSRNAAAQVDLRRERLRPIEADGAAGDELCLDVKV